jgi:hypothetical protein
MSDEIEDQSIIKSNSCTLAYIEVCELRAVGLCCFLCSESNVSPESLSGPGPRPDRVSPEAETGTKTPGYQ